MSGKSFISVIIPLFNCEKYIGEAIKSVIEQTYTDYEIIVVDDGSNDRSAEIAKGFGSKIKLFERPHEGAAAAKNFGIKESKGELLAFLDSDDIWTKDKLYLQAKEFADDKDLDMCFGRYESFISPELDEEFKKSISCPKGKMPGNIPSALMVKRSSFEKVGFLKTKWRVGEFVDWFSRAKLLGLKEKLIEEVIMKRRIHKTNMGVLEKSARIDYVRILKNSIASRKKSDGI